MSSETIDSVRVKVRSPAWAKAGRTSWICLAVVLSLSGCATETLFKSNFDQTAIGQPPASTQAVGTAAIMGPSGGVTVIAAPVSPSGKWVQVKRPNGPDVVALQGKFSQQRGDGVYIFSATMFMPSGSQVASISFETFNNPASSLESFLHIDFLTDNHVKIDDTSEFQSLTFPRDKPFIVQVTLNINGTSSTANVALAGDGASGQTDYTILTPFQGRSRQFGAIRVWQGFPHVGPFDATNISVVRRLN
jgi:hypothetical protein